MPFLQLSDADRRAMLAAIGVASIDELYAQVPGALRLQGELDLPPALSEPELRADLEELASWNSVLEPHSRWISTCDAMMLESTRHGCVGSPVSDTTAAAVSSQDVSMPRTRIMSPAWLTVRTPP